MTIPAPEKLVPAASTRLQKREKAQRLQTRKMDYKGRSLKVEPVSVDGLWLLQRGTCTCGCKQALNPLAVHPAPDSIVIAHVLLRTKGGGHTINNVRLWHKRCNDREAAKEKTAAGVGNRTGFSPERKARPKAEKPKSRMPKPPISKLSKKHPNYRKGSFG